MENYKESTTDRLEGSAPTTGGLILKKDSKSPTFKVPKPSILGLDRLAAQKRKEREEAKRLISFKDNEFDDNSQGSAAAAVSIVKERDVTFKVPDHKLSRQYRESKVETPSHTGGVSDTARNRLMEHYDKSKRGVYVSSKDEKRYDDSRHNERNWKRDKYDRYSRDNDRYRDTERNRDRHRDRSRDRGKDIHYDRRRNDSERRHKVSDSDRSLHTPKFKDEPKTPNLGITTVNTSWDDDDDESGPAKKSAWDFPTPKDPHADRNEWSVRSNKKINLKIKPEDETPRPTPMHKYNVWANDRKRSGATPSTSRKGEQPWNNDEERDMWEEEQRRLDREWYVLAKDTYMKLYCF